MGNIHLIVSKDTSYISAITRKLLSQYVDKSEAVETFEGKLAGLQQIDNALYTDSLISKNRAIIINNIDLLKTEVIEHINTFLTSSPPDQILFIMTSAHADALKDEQFGTIQSSPSIKKHIALNQTTQSLIQNYIKEHDVKITQPAVDMLVNVFEVATWGIVENELNKLSTYAGKDGKIDEAAVSELTFNINNSDTFRFVNNILAHKQKAALKDLKSIKETGVESIMVIGALAWKFRQLLAGSPNNGALIKSINLLYKYNLEIRKGLINNTTALDKLTIELLQQKFY